MKQPPPSFFLCDGGVFLWCKVDETSVEATCDRLVQAEAAGAKRTRGGLGGSGAGVPAAARFSSGQRARRPPSLFSFLFVPPFLSQRHTNKHARAPSCGTCETVTHAIVPSSTARSRTFSRRARARKKTTILCCLVLPRHAPARASCARVRAVFKQHDEQQRPGASGRLDRGARARQHLAGRGTAPARATRHR